MSNLVWFIQFRGAGGDVQRVAHMHNAIADYRSLDPTATVRVIDLAAVIDAIEAGHAVIRAFETLGETNGMGSTLRASHACEAAMVSLKKALEATGGAL